MLTEFQVYMNGISLNDIDSRIILQKVTEITPTIKRKAEQTGTHIGQIITGFERTLTGVDIEFAIAQVSDHMARAAILQAVNAWAAAGGALKVNYRPDQVMHVVCDGLTALGYSFEWTQNYKLTMRAYGVPFWQQETPAKVKAAGSCTLFVPGTTETPLELHAIATGTLNDINVQANGYKLQFTGLGMVQGDELIITHEGPIMMATIRAASGAERDALRRRTIDSHDEIWLNPGTNSIDVTCAQQVEISATGRWL